MSEPAFLRTLRTMVDRRLRELSRSLQKLLRMLRLVRALLVLSILVVLASGVIGIVRPAWFPIAYAIATIFTVIPLAVFLVLVSLPFKARSVVRLIDKGYPANARELGIRILARKLHDQSIETEELLVETALNEGRKMVRRAQRKADEASAMAQQAAQAAEEAQEAADRAKASAGQPAAGHGDPPPAP